MYERPRTKVNKTCCGSVLGSDYQLCLFCQITDIPGQIVTINCKCPLYRLTISRYWQFPHSQKMERPTVQFQILRLIVLVVQSDYKNFICRRILSSPPHYYLISLLLLENCNSSQWKVFLIFFFLQCGLLTLTLIVKVWGGEI